MYPHDYESVKYPGISTEPVMREFSSKDAEEEPVVGELPIVLDSDDSEASLTDD